MFHGKVIMDPIELERQERIAIIADGQRISQEAAEIEWTRMEEDLKNGKK